MTEKIEALPKATVEPRPLRASALQLLIVALTLGLGPNALLIQQPLGLAAPLFMATALLALFGLAYLERINPVWRNTRLAAPLLYFAIMMATRPAGFAVFLNVCAALLLADLLPLLDTAQPAERKTLGSALPLRLGELDKLQAAASWPSWNWSRWRAYQSLAAHRPALEIYVPLPYGGIGPVD